MIFSFLSKSYFRLSDTLAAYWLWGMICITALRRLRGRWAFTMALMTCTAVTSPSPVVL